MQIEWLGKALNNLEEELSYIANDDPEMARVVLQRIHDSLLLLRDNPALGQLGRIHGTRELIVPNTRYLIPYRVKPQMQQIQILRLFHTSRKLPKRW